MFTETQLGRLLRNIANSLDMPDHLQELAVAKYKEVANWLNETESPFQRTPDVFPQGSARLGTLTKPVTDRDEFDIDAVALLQIAKESVSQRELKQRTGDRLKQHPEYRLILEEKRRCWTLNFPDGLHVDILPAIPDDEGLPDSILITDRELVRWQHSDPKGYANWFLSRMNRAIFEEERLALAKALGKEIEAVPEWRVKTPLQRGIQLLKRHRDVHFLNDQEDKPTSIIITTLAAWSYNGRIDLHDVLAGMALTMADHIEERHGVYWVANPVNAKENFADKWAEYPARRQKLLTWLGKVQTDLKLLSEIRGIQEIAQALGGCFGESVTGKAVKQLGDTFVQQRQSGALRMSSGTGMLGSSGATQVRNHTFYGVAQTEKP